MPRTYSVKLASNVELSEIFGVAGPTDSHWIKRGCPFVEKGGKPRQWIFNTADVHEWRMDQLRGEYEDPQRQSNIVDYTEAR